MPCRYVIDKERRLVVTTAWDRVTFAEARAHQEQLANDPDFNQNFNQLVDASAVSSLDASPQEIQTLSSRRLFSSASRRAFIATNPVVFGMGRMLQTYLEIAKAQEQICIFYDRSSALEWLGLLSDPTLSPSH
jgi:hypothetical protein